VTPFGKWNNHEKGWLKLMQIPFGCYGRVWLVRYYGYNVLPSVISSPSLRQYRFSTQGTTFSSNQNNLPAAVWKSASVHACSRNNKFVKHRHGNCKTSNINQTITTFDGLENNNGVMGRLKQITEYKV
jgi:hypothetical protein